MTLEIDRVNSRNLNDAAMLFDLYRCFYGRLSNVVSSAKFLRERTNRGESVVFVAFEVGESSWRAVGFVQLYPSFSSVALRRVWILNDLFVAESARCCGVGRELLDRVREFANETSAARVELVTQSTNQAAMNLYVACGYAPDDEFERFTLIFT